MEESYRVVKYIIHTGSEHVTFCPGTKVFFHFKTTKCDTEKTVIDDSKVLGKPMELVLGKQFKLEVWEVIVQKMALDEVACFKVDKTLVAEYPYLSKTLREINKPPSERRNHHCCGATLQNEGIGYDDLNELIKHPQDLEFTLELIKVIPPSEYEKETWQMAQAEKLSCVPNLKEKGNALFKEKDYAAAANTYAKAIGLLEHLMLSEKPNDSEWNELNKLKIPLLLNYSQCKLINKEYYEVIQHCTTVIQTEPDNIKALYKRGKAYIGAWDKENAQKDLNKAAELDPGLRKAIDKELQAFAVLLKEKDKTQKKRLANLFK